MRTPALLCATMLSFCACEKSTTEPQLTGDDGKAYWPAAAWRTISPTEVGMNAARLKTLENRIDSKAIAELNGLVVVKNGYVVMEKYSNGSSATQVHEMQSVTKSVTSLLMGIAIDKGLIRTVDDKIFDYLPEYIDAQNMDSRKRSVTLRSLLTMQSGINFYEDPYTGSPLQQLNDSRGDWLRIVFDQPMNAAPFERWQYNSGGVISLGGVIYSAAHMTAQEFARQNLFAPLGITSTFWYSGNPNSLAHMGGGLGLRANDLARIGYLVLRNGKWNGQQVVSEQWIRESTTHSVRNPRTFGSHPTDYGYLWWLLPLDNRSGGTWDTDVITASGAKGQWLFIIPKYDLVVAATSNGAGYQGYIDPVDFLYTYIIPSIEK